MPGLGSHSYGHPHVRLLRIARRGDRHDIKELTVAVRFEGDFDAAHLKGDSRLILPSDTIKQAVYAAASSRQLTELEEFGLILSEHFLARHRQISRVRIELADEPWSRMAFGEKPQGTIFEGGSGEKRIAVITSNGERVAVVAGVEDLRLMKTTASPPLAATLSARWTYIKPEITFGAYFKGVRQTLLNAFIEHDGRSLQQTAYAMGEAVLANYEEISDVTVTLSTRTHHAVDLSAVGIDSPADVLVPGAETDGIIEATVTR